MTRRDANNLPPGSRLLAPGSPHLAPGTSFDLIIIGGGINGAAIARDAALRGLSVVLLEKEDFASGASSTNSKLIHGGVRYLAHLDFRQVYESLRERDLLLKNAPELVSPRPFVFPIFSGLTRPLWLVNLGLTLYDWLDRAKALPRHAKLSAKEVLNYFPGLKQEGLKGGCLYYDAQMKDARLVLETILDAEALGAQCWNYVKVERLRGKSVDCVSERRGWHGTIQGKAIVNATGAWANTFLGMDHDHGCRVRPSKGVHLVIPQVHPTEALLLSAPQDGRVFFIIPWENFSLLGTTDTFYENDPDQVAVLPQDIEYLQTAFQAYFQAPCKVISSFVGLRPLPLVSQRDPSNISRQEIIHESPTGMISVIGGKFTTHRLMAEQVVDLVCARLQCDSPCSTATRPLKASQPAEDQIRHAVLVEKAMTLADWYFRRTSIGYGPDRGLDSLPAVAQEFARLHGWDEARQQAEVEKYVEQVRA